MFFCNKPGFGQSENEFQSAEEVFIVVDCNPVFPGCEDFATTEKKKACADQKLNQFIHNNIKYPVKAGVEGTVIANFTIKKDGSVQDIQLIKKLNLCQACNKEVIRVLKLMPRWTPASARCRPVKVKYQVKIVFDLQEEGKNKPAKAGVTNW
ncbi:MAG: energy transducer TonB [Saprospiraceae bacterium]